MSRVRNKPFDNCSMIDITGLFFSKLLVMKLHIFQVKINSGIFMNIGNDARSKYVWIVIL